MTYSAKASKEILDIRLLILLLIVATAGSFFIAFAFHEVEACFVTMLLTWTFCFIWSILGNSRYATLSIFYVLFFFFILGHSIFGFLNKTGFGYETFPIEAQLHTALVLQLSLIFSTLGYILVSKINLHKILHDNREIEQKKYQRKILIRQSCKIVFYICCVFSFIISIEKGISVQANGYLSYYTSYQSSLPSWFGNLASMAKVALFVFWATMPSRKECRMPTIIFFLSESSSLLYGQRNGFALAVAMIVLYYAFRQCNRTENEYWITNKTVIFGIIVIPVMVMFLYLFGFIRSNQALTIDSNFISDFISEQSAYTSQIIPYGYEAKEALERDYSYIFSSISDVVTQNGIIHAIFGTDLAPKAHTEAMARYWHNYGQSFMYTVQPNAYLLGNAWGSTYIAEAFQDFGYFGVIGINIVYGALLASLTSVVSKGPFVGCLALMMVMNIIYSIRSAASDFITKTFTMTTLFTFIIIQIVVLMLRNRKSLIVSEESDK